jgi:hypothetical protein
VVQFQILIVESVLKHVWGRKELFFNDVLAGLGRDSDEEFLDDFDDPVPAPFEHSVVFDFVFNIEVHELNGGDK